MIDKCIGLGIACLAVLLLFIWPFNGIHPCAWEETAVAAGLLPQSRFIPGLGTYLAHLVFSAFPYGTALTLVGLAAKFLVGACGFLAYGCFVKLADVATSVVAHDFPRRRLAARLAAAVGALGLVCSEPIWMVAQGRLDQALVVFLVALAAWFFLSFMSRASYAMAVAAFLTMGLLCAETPFGWILLALLVSLAVRLRSNMEGEEWNAFLDPMRIQGTRWVLTFSFFGALLVGVLLEGYAFARLDGMRAAGITAGDLPVAFLKDYFGVFASSCNLLGLGFFAGAVVIPTVLTIILIRPATDEERYLDFRHLLAFILCGAVAFLQLSPFDVSWFWNQTTLARVSTSLLPYGMLLEAFVLTGALFVLFVEVFCRDYVRIERMFRRDGRDAERIPSGLSSVWLSPGRVIVFALPVVFVVLLIWGRRLPDDRRLVSLLRAFVEETVTEAAGSKCLFTDGAFDAYVRLEACRRGGTGIHPVSMMSGRSSYDVYVRQLGFEGVEDRTTLASGASEALWTWVVAKPERVADVAVQLAFEYFRLNRDLKPMSYGLLVRPVGGDQKAADESIVRCHALADEIVALHDAGVWRHARDPLVKDRVLFAQFRLAVIARLRAINLDLAKRGKESIEEIGYADRLNACNPSFAKVVRRMDWIRRQNGGDLTPREGLEVAMKRLDFKMARRFAYPILKDDPDEPNANFAIGMGFYAEEQYAKAEEFLRRVLKRNPKEPAVYNNLALIYLRTGRLDEAEKNVQKALELMPNQPEIRETQSQVNKAKQERLPSQALPGRKESYK